MEPTTSRSAADVPASPAPLDLGAWLPQGAQGEALAAQGVASLLRGLEAPETMRIVQETWGLRARGVDLCNFAAVDFDSSLFPIPRGLREGVIRALEAGHTTYAPGEGVLALRQAVQRYYARALGLNYPLPSILVAAGARPLIEAVYAAVLEPGDKVVSPVPSWSHALYVHLHRAVPVLVPVGPEQGFLPTAAQLAPVLRDARLLCLTSPLNPAGTVLGEAAAEEIGHLVVDENRRRQRDGQRPLYLMLDQLYQALTFAPHRHISPVHRVPEVAAWTVTVDGITKLLAATGLRVGWSTGPAYLLARMRDYLGGIGACAPTPEQVATAQFLDDVPALEQFLASLRGELHARLRTLHQGLVALRDEGLPVEVVEPQAGLYLGARFKLLGWRLGGQRVTSDEQIRQYLRDEARVALLPFQAFGLSEQSGWFRLAVCGVSHEQMAAGLERLGDVLRAAAAAQTDDR